MLAVIGQGHKAKVTRSRSASAMRNTQTVIYVRSGFAGQGKLWYRGTFVMRF